MKRLSMKWLAVLVSAAMICALLSAAGSPGLRVYATTDEITDDADSTNDTDADSDEDQDGSTDVDIDTSDDVSTDTAEDSSDNSDDTGSEEDQDDGTDLDTDTIDDDSTDSGEDGSDNSDVTEDTEEDETEDTENDTDADGEIYAAAVSYEEEEDDPEVQEDTVASITKDGETRYFTTLEAAVNDDYADGEIIVLLSDVQEDVEIGSDLGVTLDLGGYTLKGTGSSSVITIYGDLTIEDSGDDGTITGGGGSAISYEEDGETYSYSMGGGIFVAGGSLTINGGTISGNSCYGDGPGGGVYVSSGTLTMNGGTITGNTSESVGGGVFLWMGTMTMNGGTISDNTALNGGGVYFAQSKFTMNGGTISGNSAGTDGDYNGGGIMAYASTLTITGGTISNNTAGSDEEGSGGGIWIYNSELTMSGGTISGNSTGWAGGGIWVSDFSTLTMSGGTISDNQASDGAGIATCAGEDYGLTISGGSIENNTASSSGAGIFVCDNTELIITGGSITGNSSGGTGGGIELNGDVSIAGASLVMSGGTISGNSAYGGGGGLALWGESQATITGGILANNTVENYEDGNGGADIYVDVPGQEESGTALITIGSEVNENVEYEADDQGSIIDGWYDELNGGKYTPSEDGAERLVDVSETLSVTGDDSGYRLVASYTVTSQENDDDTDVEEDSEDTEDSSDSSDSDDSDTSSDSSGSSSSSSESSSDLSDSSDAAQDTPLAAMLLNTTDVASNSYGGWIAESTAELEKLLLTEEERAILAAGTSIRVWLEMEMADITNIADSISEEEKALIDSVKGDASVAFYLDISLYKQIGGADPVRITNSNGEVTISFSLPAQLLNTDSEILRVFQIVRVHSGIAQVLPTVYDSATGTITFETDRFSTYALIYTDLSANETGVTNVGSTGSAAVSTAAALNGSNETYEATITSSTSRNAAATGDESWLFIWFVVMAVSAGALVILLCTRRSNR